MNTENQVLPRWAFTKMAVTIALPGIVNNLISTLVSTADTVMLGYISQNAMSASSLANQLQTVISMTLYGMMAGASVLTAQYWGKKDYRTIEKVLAIAMKGALLLALVFFTAAFGFPTFVMKCFTEDEELISLGASYLRIIAFSYIFMCFSSIFVTVLRSIERVVIPTVTYIVSLAVNVTLNATFIFGLFGAPKLGLVGVALGTVVARIVECLICIIYSQACSEIKFRVKLLFRSAGVLTKDFLKLSLPSMVNDAAWSLAASMYSVAIGHLGSDAVAANAVAIMALNIGAVVCRGFAGGTTIIVSKALGENNMAAAKIYSERMLFLSTIFAIVGGGVMAAIRPIVISVYEDKLTETAIHYLSIMLLMRAVQLTGEAINTCLICGCFRGGGDAKFGMILDCTFMWCIAVPVVSAATFLFKLPVLTVYLLITLDEFEKMLPAVIHYVKFKWMHNITRDESELQ